MGVDILGWRSCHLQDALGASSFLGKIKLRSYQRLIERQIPEDQRRGARIAVQGANDVPREWTYKEIWQEMEYFHRGTPECRQCPLGSDGAVGCYRTISYPIDAVAERLLFECFTSGLAEPDSTAATLFRQALAHAPPSGPWHASRGPQGKMAELLEPLEFAWEAEASAHRVDSAQLLASLFVNLDQPDRVQTTARFFSEFMAFAKKRAGVQPDGSVQVRIDAQGTDSQAEISRRTKLAVEAVKAIANSRTVREIEAAERLLSLVAEHAAQDHWVVLMDS
ncbi:MAG: hypothetical protein HY898_18355 [Deltaproteobacteria bacterium]|nr:hypothetical protein [Deltaproteobacteria bacterium]